MLTTPKSTQVHQPQTPRRQSAQWQTALSESMSGWVATDWHSTGTRLRSSGWDRGSSWRSWIWPDIQMQKCTVRPSVVVNNFGFHMDSNLTSSKHMAKVSQSCFFQLQPIRTIHHYITAAAASTLVLAFFSSRLEYCNSLLYGVSDSLELRKLNRISHVLREPHWLLVNQRNNLQVCPTIF